MQASTRADSDGAHVVDSWVLRDGTCLATRSGTEDPLKFGLKLFFCSAALAVYLIAQSSTGALTNQKIGELVRLGVRPAEVVRMIQSAPTVAFDLRPVSTDNLLAAGVPEDVIKAMAAKQNGLPIQATTHSEVRHESVAARDQISAEITEVGVYYRDGGPWIRMMPEIANWQTGGVIKSATTLAIIKKDLNGRIAGSQAKIHLRSVDEILIYCPEATEVTEYQLLKLREHHNAREFRAVTGGVFHQSGGAKRDLVQFDPTPVNDRSYTFPLSGLAAGQYGLMPPGSYLSHGPSAQFGKVYTFSISE
jgi:hypothetical protein